MKPLTGLYPYILPFVPGAPEPMVDLALLWAVNEFLGATHMLRDDTQPALDAVAGTASYVAVPPDANHVVHTVLSVRFNDKPVTFKAEDAMDLEWVENGTQTRLLTLYGSNFYGPNRSDDWRAYTVTDPVFYYLKLPNTIRFIGIPDTDQAGAITYTTALKLPPAATDLDDFVYDNYYETLARGAVAYLQAMPRKPWSDPTAALMKDGFAQSCADANADAQRSLGRNDGQGRVRAWP